MDCIIAPLRSSGENRVAVRRGRSVGALWVVVGESGQQSSRDLRRLVAASDHD